jgi:hypothetical protein
MYIIPVYIIPLSPGDDQQPTPYAEVTFRRQLLYPRTPSSHQSLGPVRARITHPLLKTSNGPENHYSRPVRPPLPERPHRALVM